MLKERKGCILKVNDLDLVGSEWIELTACIGEKLVAVEVKAMIKEKSS